MIRHILFWNYTEKVKEKHGEEEAFGLCKIQWRR